MRELKPKTVNACWKALWNEAVHDFTGFPDLAMEMSAIVSAATQIEGLQDISVSDVQELIESHTQELTEAELEELVKSSSDEEDGEVEAIPEPKITIAGLDHVFGSADKLQVIFELYPFMETSLKTKRLITKALEPYSELKKDLVRTATQKKITSFFTPSPKPAKATSGPPSSVPTTSTVSSQPSGLEDDKVIVLHGFLTHTQPIASHQKDDLDVSDAIMKSIEDMEDMEDMEAAYLKSNKRLKVEESSAVVDV